MRILVVAERAPYRPCHDRRRLLPAQLLAHLGTRHALGLVAPATPGDTPGQRDWAAPHAVWRETVAAGRLRHPLTGEPGEGLAAVRHAVERAIDRFAPDVLHLEGSLLAPLGRAGGVPTVLVCRTAPALRARACRPRSWSPWERLRAEIDERREAGWERRWFAGVDACVVATEEDRAALAAHLPFERIEVIPSGIDPRHHAFRRRGEPGRLVLAGPLAGPAAVEAAERAATAVLPRVRRTLPRAELLIAGADPDPAVRALAPARARSGLVELLPGHHLLEAESDAETAEAALLLMQEPVVAGMIARNARDVVERRYAGAAVARRYEALYARLAAAAPAAVAA